jgi:prepilin-type N-terminal cleavage/methylation domain-containing protein
MNTSTNRSKRATQAGVTLLEMMVAIGILSMVLLMAFAALKGTTDVSSMEYTRNDLDRTGAKALETMAAELKHASVLGTAADGSVLVFQVPADLDGSGTVLDKNGDCEFGITDDGKISTGSINFQFVQNKGTIVGDVLNEKNLRRDLNNDGDQNDVFDRGRIMRATTRIGSSPRTVSGFWIVQPNSNWGGDIDGDGSPDPIFSVSGKRVSINLWMIATDQSGMQHLVHCQTSVQCRN